MGKKLLEPVIKAPVRQERWYFGGLSGVLAACCTHPLDTLKVQLQTQQRAEYGLISMGAKVIGDNGISALYNGLSASCLRQATYTTTRFAIYGGARSLRPNSNLSFFEKVSLAAGSGAIGAFVGAPADLINVRMQNDSKLPMEQRRNYKHAIDGIARICREKGFVKLFNGATMAVTRGAFVTVGQIAFYEQIKQVLLASGYFKDNISTHFTSSFTAGYFHILTIQNKLCFFFFL
jgi:dicarboxylate transporter 10